MKPPSSCEFCINQIGAACLQCEKPVCPFCAVAGLCPGCAPPLTLTSPDGATVDLGRLIPILAASPGQLWPPLTLTVAGLPLLATRWTIAPGPCLPGLLCAVAHVPALLCTVAHVPTRPFHSSESLLLVQIGVLPDLLTDEAVLGAAFARDAAEATLRAAPAPDVATLLPHLWAGMQTRLRERAAHHQRQVQVLQRLLDPTPTPTPTPTPAPVEPTL